MDGKTLWTGTKETIGVIATVAIAAAGATATYKMVKGMEAENTVKKNLPANVDHTVAGAVMRAWSIGR